MSSALLLIIFVTILINVAFITLMERKILGLSQYRKGPNKVTLLGFLQPIADAIKLFMKEMVFPFKSNKTLYAFSPVAALALALGLWVTISHSENLFSMWVSSILFITLLGFGTYPLLMAGWSSNSKYAMVGALRGVAQTISYEISLALILLSFLMLTMTMKLAILFNINAFLPLSMLSPAMGGMWFISCVAETNRTPFDFAEGESELVSGFNVEYGAGAFAMIFMAEYCMILFLSMLSGLILISPSASAFLSSAAMAGLAFTWIWLRASYPRYRYDKLMSLAWKAILPNTLLNLMWVAPAISLFLN